MARHERYLEEKDRTNKNVNFGYEDEIVHLLPRRLLEPAITPETKLLLNEALNALKCKNKICYDVVPFIIYRQIPATSIIFRNIYFRTVSIHRRT